MDNFDLALVIFLEDEESSSSDEETKRSQESEMFKKRKSEGVYEILIRRHLQASDVKFREYFRLTPVLFDYVFNHIKDDIASKPYNRNKNPITPEQKLCIFLR